MEARAILIIILSNLFESTTSDVYANELSTKKNAF